MESPVDRAAQAVHMAVADFAIAIFDAQTTAEALTIHRVVGQVLASLGAMESAALEKADRLCGQTLSAGSRS